MKRVLLYLLLAVPVLSFAQSNFHKGYILTNSSDTLKGYIDYKEREQNPLIVIFKKELADQPQSFTVGNCTGYGINEMEVYQRAVIDISMSKIEVPNLSTGLDSSSRRDIVFLKVLQAGKNITLYSYRDDIKQRFYLKDRNNTVPYELIRQTYIDPVSDHLVERNKYARQLLIEMMKFKAGTEIQQQKTLSLRYDETAILKVVSLINDEQPVKSKYSGSKFFIGTGATSSKMGYSGASQFTNGAQSKSSILPFFTAGVDFFANPAIGKLIFRLELSFLASKTDISKHDNSPSAFEPYMDHSFNQISAAFTPQFIYNIYNTDPLKIFVGAGVGFNLSSYSHNESTYTDIYGNTQTQYQQVEFQTFNFSFPAVAGIVLNKKMEISAGYIFPYAITNYQSFNVTMQRYKLGISYLFGKN